MLCRRTEFAILPFLIALVCASLQPAAAQTMAADWVRTSQSCQNDLCRFQSLQKALTADPASADAHRSLGDYYLSRSQFDAARQQYLLALKSSPSDWRARKQVADLDLRDGKLRTALTGYRRLEQEQSGNPDLQSSLAEAYERLGYSEDAERLAMSALRLRPRDSNSQTIALRLARTRRDTAALISIYETIFDADPADSQSAIRASELLQEQGDAAQARALLQRAVAIRPGDGELRDALRLLDGSTAASAERDELSGESAQLHQEWQSGTLNLKDSDAPFLADANAILRSSPKELPTNNDAMMLADVRIDRVGPTGLATSHVQQFILLGTDAGARRYSVRSIQYSPASENISIVRARLHKPDGRVIDGEDQGDERVADQASAMYYDVRSRSVRFPTAEPGDVVELEYCVSPATNDNPYGNYFASMQMFRSSLPTRMKRYVVIADANRKLYITGQSMPQLQSSVDGHEKVYRWDAADLAALPSEPLGPPATELSPYVHVSTMRDFAELGQWYSAMLTPQLNLSPELKEKAKQIAAAYPNAIDRVRAVYRFVLTSTHYVALEFGIYSYKPYPVADVYARRFGDCKDKASLMVAMLRAVGVPADFVLVRTRPLGSVVPNAASIALFNHAIAYVPQFNLWLDGTADYYGVGELPQDDQGAMALTVAADGTAQLRTIPGSSSTDNQTARVVRAEIHRTGVIDFTGTSMTRGEDAPALRRDYEVQERQRDTMRRGLAELFPTVKLDAVNVDNADSDHPVQVRFAGTLDVFKGQHTLDLRSTWLQRDYLQRLALLSSRKYDLQLGSPWKTDEEFHFHLPAGATISHLPQDTRLHTDFGSATLHYTLIGRELVIRTSVQFSRSRIETSEYPQFRQFCAVLEEAFRRDVTVVLP